MKTSFKYFFISLFVGIWLVVCGQLLVPEGILTKAEISCDGDLCTLSDKTFSAKVIKEFSFNQALAVKITVQKSSRGYELTLEKKYLDSCTPECGEEENEAFPFSWYRPTKATELKRKITAGKKVLYSQCNISARWLVSAVLCSILLVLLLYRIDKKK